MTSTSSPPLLLVRRPSPLLSSGQLTHLDPSSDPPDPARSLAQWTAYCDVYRSLGWQVIEVPSADECPDGVFLEDALVVFPSLVSQSDDAQEEQRGAGVVVLPRSGSMARRGEYPTAKRAAEEYLIPRGLEIFDFMVEDPSGEATLDGGDILKILPIEGFDHQGEEDSLTTTSISSRRVATVYVGQSSRTNPLGLSLLKKTLEPRGWKVKGVPVEHHLHLKSAITALPDGQVIGHPLPLPLPRQITSSTPSLITGTNNLLAGDDVGVTLPDAEPILHIQEEHGIAVVDLSTTPTSSKKKKKRTILLSKDAPKTKKQLELRGYEVLTVDIGDFEKMEGCVTCLSVRVRT